MLQPGRWLRRIKLSVRGESPYPAASVTKSDAPCHIHALGRPQAVAGFHLEALHRTSRDGVKVPLCETLVAGSRNGNHHGLDRPSPVICDTHEKGSRRTPFRIEILPTHDGTDGCPHEQRLIPAFPVRLLLMVVPDNRQGPDERANRANSSRPIRHIAPLKRQPSRVTPGHELVTDCSEQVPIKHHKRRFGHFREVQEMAVTRTNGCKAARCNLSMAGVRVPLRAHRSGHSDAVGTHLLSLRSWSALRARVERAEDRKPAEYSSC